MESDSQTSVAVPTGQSGGISELLVDSLGREIDADGLLAWSDRLVTELAPRSDSLTIRLSDEPSMQSLNRRYRDLDKSTDVLSFPGGSSPEGRHLGDIVIAAPVAQRQAAAAGHSLESELKTLILHGVLHCLGHDHETDDGEMDALERELRKRWVEDDD